MVRRAQTRHIPDNAAPRPWGTLQDKAKMNSFPKNKQWGTHKTIELRFVIRLQLAILAVTPCILSVFRNGLRLDEKTRA